MMIDKKIMVVDDEEKLQSMITSILQDYGFTHIEATGSVFQGRKLFMAFNPEIVILDIMLPDGSGYDLLDFMRRKSDVPVIFLSAKGEDDDKLRGLSLGADDYIVKPFLPKELILRMEAILRRVYPESSVVPLKYSTIDFHTGHVTKNREVIPLTATEFKILDKLNKNAGRIVTIDSLCETVWQNHVWGYENSLMAHIRRIREKIEINPSKPVSLITLRGLGYKLITENKGYPPI
ncbi:response regulator transcription factor [Sediminibacillus dalangtanensis]